MIVSGSAPMSADSESVSGADTPADDAVDAEVRFNDALEKAINLFCVRRSVHPTILSITAVGGFFRGFNQSLLAKQGQPPPNSLVR